MGWITHRLFKFPSGSDASRFHSSLIDNVSHENMPHFREGGQEMGGGRPSRLPQAGAGGLSRRRKPRGQRFGGVSKGKR